MSTKLDYIMHMFRRLQDGNSDISCLVTGDKGTGKSNTILYMIMKYLDMYSFVCPHCGAEFYKNIYDIEWDDNNNPKFFKPKNTSEIHIRCPIEKKLNMTTKKLEPIRGCGKTFPLSQRRKIKFDANKFIAYDNQDVLDKMFDMPQYAPIGLDEAYNVLAGANHNKSEVKYLKEKINVIRPKRHIIFYAIPEITWLDSKVREGFANFWIRMIDRGECVLFEKDKGESIDKWHLKELNKSMGVVRFFSSPTKILRSLKKTATYFDNFSVPAVPESIYTEYEYYRNAKNIQRELEEMEVSDKDNAKIVAWNLLNRWDRIRLAIDKSKSGKCTYKILTDEIMVNPVTRKSLATEPTIRNWVQGVNKYVKSQGKEIAEFAEEAEAKDGDSEVEDSGPKLEIIGEDTTPVKVVDIDAEVIEL